MGHRCSDQDQDTSRSTRAKGVSHSWLVSVPGRLVVPGMLPAHPRAPQPLLPAAPEAPWPHMLNRGDQRWQPRHGRDVPGCSCGHCQDGAFQGAGPPLVLSLPSWALAMAASAAPVPVREWGWQHGCVLRSSMPGPCLGQASGMASFWFCWHLITSREPPGSTERQLGRSVDGSRGTGGILPARWQVPAPTPGSQPGSPCPLPAHGGQQPPPTPAQVQGPCGDRAVSPAPAAPRRLPRRHLLLGIGAIIVTITSHYGL